MISNSQQKYWIIATPDEVFNHNDFFKFNHTMIHECRSPKQHPRLDVYDDLSFGVLNIMDHSPDRFIAKEINFFFTPSHLIFVSKEKCHLFETIKNELFENTHQSTTYLVSFSKIIYMLFDKLTAMDGNILNEIENKIAKLEQQVMEGIKKDYTQIIVELRKQLFFLKRHYEPLLDIVEDFQENENNLIEESAIKYFKILNNRVARLNANVFNLRDYITQVREAYQAQVDINLNRIMKLFTVVTTIFLPLTLIAGWYGMNFKYMPELSWFYGYPFAFFLSGIVIAVSLVYFRHHDYI
jgi:magnesium transporter